MTRKFPIGIVQQTLLGRVGLKVSQNQLIRPGLTRHLSHMRRMTVATVVARVGLEIHRFVNQNVHTRRAVPDCVTGSGVTGEENLFAVTFNKKTQ
jgi:hypothetical protein